MSAIKEKKISAKALKEEEASQLPSAEIAKERLEELFSCLNKPYLQSFLSRIQQLAKKPPQVLLIEGGTEKIRYAMSLYYACLLNCTTKSQLIQEPCCDCPSCLEIANTFSPDLIIFDGLQERIKIQPIRDLIPIIANAPSFLKTRLILFYEAAAFTKESANALLKTLEEPNTTTHFVMTVTMRERLYPTLVSRSIIFSLPTEVHRKYNDEERQILNALNIFFREGKGFFEQYTSKKTFSIHEARLILNVFMASISLAYTKDINANLIENHAFVDFLAAKLSPEKTNTCVQFIEESTEILENSTSPKIDLIIDTLLVQAYMLINEN